MSERRGETKMSHCAVCGSSSVRSTQESDGYSYKKGIAGTLVFGVIGAVAGINGKKKDSL